MDAPRPLMPAPTATLALKVLWRYHVKKLSDAIRNNDPIRAVIKSTCLNSDGRTSNMSQPSLQSHAALIRRSHKLAGITDVCTTAMIECHGTGTLVGDPVEASAVAEVFGEKGIFIGSVRPDVRYCTSLC